MSADFVSERHRILPNEQDRHAVVRRDRREGKRIEELVRVGPVGEEHSRTMITAYVSHAESDVAGHVVPVATSDAFDVCGPAGGRLDLLVDRVGIVTGPPTTCTLTFPLKPRMSASLTIISWLARRVLRNEEQRRVVRPAEPTRRERIGHRGIVTGGDDDITHVLVRWPPRGDLELTRDIEPVRSGDPLVPARDPAPVTTTASRDRRPISCRQLRRVGRSHRPPSRRG